MQRVALARLAHTFGLVLWTTMEVLFHEQGPLAAICLQGMSQRIKASQPGGTHRRCLFDALLGKNYM